MIHKLAARALIRDYEDGALHEDETHHEVGSFRRKASLIVLGLSWADCPWRCNVREDAWMESALSSLRRFRARVQGSVVP